MDELRYVYQKDMGMRLDWPCVIAGPCAIESYDQLLRIASLAKAQGASMIRGGAYKPRTSPYSFQGLGDQGLLILQKVRKELEMPVVTEILDVRDLHKIMECCDVIQVGSRNMQNTPLLKELGKVNKPILLKRGMMATIQDFLCAAEYILKEGNKNVILCERGIRTFETLTRNTLDISAIALLKNMTSLPVIVDPSHAAGRSDLVLPLSKAALMAGADGLMIDVHDDPARALCDGKQALSFGAFKNSMSELKKVICFLNKH